MCKERKRERMDDGVSLASRGGWGGPGRPGVQLQLLDLHIQCMEEKISRNRFRS